VWHVDSVGLNADGQRLVPDNVRALSVTLLDKALQGVSLVDWLESILPPRSMVIWPDVPGACGEAPGIGGKAPSAQCAEIRYNDVDGNGGTIYIALNKASENSPLKASFHSGYYVSGDKSRPLGSLAGLREILAAGTK
jgi:hypothetical protein